MADLGLQWAPKVLRHFAIFEYFRRISPLNSKILSPSQFSMLDFLFLKLCSFLCNTEKREGNGSQCKQDKKWKKWKCSKEHSIQSTVSATLVDHCRKEWVSLISHLLPYPQLPTWEMGFVHWPGSLILQVENYWNGIRTSPFVLLALPTPFLFLAWFLPARLKCGTLQAGAQGGGQFLGLFSPGAIDNYWLTLQKASSLKQPE